MKSSTTIIFTLLISTVSFSQTITPSVVNASGGAEKIGYYQFEWSVGELALVDEMQAPNKLIVTNGFLQPYLVNPASSDPGVFFTADEVKVFPNPAPRYIEINFFTKQKGRVTIVLYDAIGKKVYSQELRSYGVDLIHRIPVANFMSGTYMMNITMNSDLGTPVKQGAYKVVKID